MLSYLTQAVPAWHEHKVDVIFRGAPHLLAVAAGPDAACPQEDVNLALADFELMAACAGLGTVWCGLAKMALELLPELKADLGLAPDRYYYTMLFGVPAVRYARTVQRDGTERIRRIRDLSRLGERSQGCGVGVEPGDTGRELGWHCVGRPFF